MDYGEGRFRYDRGASHPKIPRFSNLSTEQYQLGTSTDMSSLKSMPGFAQFARESSGFDESTFQQQMDNSTSFPSNLGPSWSADAETGRYQSPAYGQSRNVTPVWGSGAARKSQRTGNLASSYSSLMMQNNPVSSSEGNFGYEAAMNSVDSFGPGPNISQRAASGLPGSLQYKRNTDYRRRNRDLQLTNVDGGNLVSQQGRDFGHSGPLVGDQRRKRPLPPPQEDSDVDWGVKIASEIQNRTRKKVNVNKILKVMKIVDRLEEMEREQPTMNPIERDQRGGILAMEGGPNSQGMGADGRFGTAELGMPMMDQGLGMDTMGPGEPAVMQGAGSLGRRPFSVPGRPGSKRPGMGPWPGPGGDISLGVRKETMIMGHNARDMRGVTGNRVMPDGIGLGPMGAGPRGMDGRPRNMDGRPKGFDGRPRIMDALDQSEQVEMNLPPWERMSRPDHRGPPGIMPPQGVQPPRHQLSGMMRQHHHADLPHKKFTNMAGNNGNAASMGRVSGTEPHGALRHGNPRNAEFGPPQGRNLPNTIPNPNNMRVLPYARNQGNPKNMSLVEKVSRFITFLKREDPTKNTINLLDCAFDRCKLDLKKDFKCEHFLTVGQQEMYSARLFMGEVFLARTYGSEKKLIKSQCYEKAFKLLTTKSPKDIVNQKDPKTDKVAEELLLLQEKMEGSKKDAEVSAGERKSVAPMRSVKNLVAVLVDYVKALTPTREHIVFHLDKSFKTSGVLLHYDYTDEEVEYLNKLPWFIGYFKIQHTLVAAGSGLTRESTKKNTYEQARKYLSEVPLSKIINGRTINKRKLMPAVEAVTEKLYLPNSLTEEKLGCLIGLVTKEPDGELVKWFKDCVKAAKLNLLTLYRKEKKNDGKFSSICDLFLDNIYLASGDGNGHLEAEAKVFEEALEIFSSSSADVIYNEFKRLSAEDTVGVFEATEVFDNNIQRSEYRNNLIKLEEHRSFFRHAEGEEKEAVLNRCRDRDDIILVEHRDWRTDRFNKAFEILQMSAKMNLMALHTVMTSKGTEFRCRLYLQYELVAEATTKKKFVSKTQAAAAFLFQQYQTRPTIKMTDTNASDTSYTYASITEKAEGLKEESGGQASEDEDIVFTKDGDLLEAGNPEKVEGMEIDGEPEEETFKVNKWIAEVIESMIKELASRETLECLMFEHGERRGYMQYIRLCANKYKVYCSVIKQTQHLAVQKRYTVTKLLEILEKNNGKSGKYEILAKSKLPKQHELEKYQTDTDRMQNPLRIDVQSGEKPSNSRLPKKRKVRRGGKKVVRVA